MKNFEKKETNLNQLIEKLGKLNTSYSQHNIDNKSIERERDLIRSEKDELEKKMNLKEVIYKGRRTFPQYTRFMTIGFY